MEQIAADARSSAPRERVWERLTDTAAWADWAPFQSASVETPGPDEPEGVGMVRRLGRGMGQVTVERITEFEPPERFAYELVYGVPVSDYSAVVTLTEDGGGKLISWRSVFRGKFPVPVALVRPPLERFIRRSAEGLARAAESE
jgi:uncharacterized protein YndB with AHSA1/START domain